MNKSASIPVSRPTVGQSGVQLPPSPQSPSTKQLPSAPAERVQHILLSQASRAAQTQPRSPTQLHIPSPFPPRRPLRHQLQFPYQHPPQQQAPSSAVPTSPGSPTSNLPGIASALSAPSQMPGVTGSVNLFDGVWRAMLDRVYDELAHVHTLYAGALRKEQQEKEIFRAHCIRLKGERDFAREKLRRSLERRSEDADATQLPPTDTPDATTTDDPAPSPDSRSLTPPPSAASASFPTTLTAEQIFCDQKRSTDENPTESLDPSPSSYPSPSPSCSSPPPPRPPLLFRRGALLLSKSGSPELEEIPATDDPKDVISALFRGIDGEKARKRECCDDEDGDARSAKRRRTPQDSDDNTEDVDDGDGGDHFPSQCPGSQSEEEAGEYVTAMIDESSTPDSGSSTASRWSMSLDLMYQFADDKLLCRICSYKHTRGMTPSPKFFSRTASWAELTRHVEREHPAACVGVASMTPAEVVELRQRLMSAASDA